MNIDLKKRRKRLDLTQGQLANKVGVALETVRRWEKTPAEPNEENEKKLKEVLQNE